MAFTSTSSRPSLTAIVAATQENGIGVNGGLPWRLPGELKYFARVTTGENPSIAAVKQNVLIMGRKTWESIPPKFRPLKSRQNLVISGKGVDLGGAENSTAHDSLDSALSALPSGPEAPRAFLIGGSTLYTTALLSPSSERPLVDRVLLTRILSQFECDAHLENFASHQTPSGEKLWKKSSTQELREWIGWDVEEEQEEKGIKYRYEMWVLNQS
ncbi:hypothetical protein B9479_003287 [Cryptococcus floricola]|uniref:Dihydrofolate reductase n=1 Tax=Cryptococcus floricola TaxID=2591691 RepID=A0A5D3AZZ0_9TREE|nr:hypothetical protein B9479_003287 [Cryptococcus floricola]